MIKITDVEVVGWEHAIRGMRNPMNSWDKSDSFVCNGEDCPLVLKYRLDETDDHLWKCDNGELGFCVGANDHDLMMKLSNAGTDHRKFMRMIVVYADITAPMYWWKEFDTYKVGTVRNSCSTMHKIHSEEFTLDDFSCENIRDIHIGDDCLHNFNESLKIIIRDLNLARQLYIKTNLKVYWWQMIQLLPSSYNQKSTVMLNYEVLANMYHSRKNHKLDEWREFCEWVETLPYSELITGDTQKVRKEE